MLALILGLSVAWAVKPAAPPVSSSASSNVVKTCLAEVYKAQSRTRTNSAAYGTSVEQIGMSSSAVCKDVSLDFSNVQEKAFTVVGEHAGEKWSIDDGKTLRDLSR